MKTIMKIVLSLSVLSFITYILSCSENNSISYSEKEIEFSAYQIPGCQSQYSLNKTRSEDSNFSYTFIDILKVDFLVLANCCPDSNRFFTSYNINNDTIFVSVKDIITSGGCFCNCYYTIHLEITGLLKDRYLFYCDYTGMNNYTDSVIYREILLRGKKLSK